MRKIIEDKRILLIYVLVIITIVLGVTYALGNGSLALNINTALIRIDEEAYGDTTFNTSDLDFRPILDSDVETSTDNVIKIEFKVGGNSTNTADNIIYDIALNDLQVSCELLSPYIKWKLLKNNTEIFAGSLDYKFDTIKDGRLVLTNIQQELPDYNADETGYDSYTFYMWFSDSCQSDLATCVSNDQVVEQSGLLRKLLSGKIEVELYTGSTKALVRSPSNSLNTNTCMQEVGLLSEMPVGSYVKYVGNNGCTGKSCEGQNANYVDDNNKGYCNNPDYKFYENGWKIGYIENGSAHLVSAGAPECVATYSESIATTTSVVDLSGYYYYGSDYVFDSKTGEFRLTGTLMFLSYRDTDVQGDIVNGLNYTCLSIDNTGTCTTLYKVVFDDNSINLSAWQGSSYIYSRTYETTSGTPLHLENLNENALKYCNPNYAKNGVCNGTTAWAMNSNDFEKVMNYFNGYYGSSLSSCLETSNVTYCGANIHLIDNGGQYWFASNYMSSEIFRWDPYGQGVSNNVSSNSYGLRPILYLDSSVIVVGGTGTYEDPYIIVN